MRISDWSSDVCSSDLHSAANPQIAVGVDRAGVAGMIPAVSVDRRLIGSPPIALHDAVRSHHDLPDRVGAERMVLFVDDADLDSRHRRGRKRVVSGKSVSVRGDLGGRLIINKKNNYR